MQRSLRASVASRHGDDLRRYLRLKTRHSHLRIDGLFGALDLSSRDGQIIFMRSHYLAYRSFEPVLPVGSEVHSAIRRNIGLLSLWLADAGVEAPRAGAITLSPARVGLGTSYVLAGSSLGKRVLAKFWTAPDSSESDAPLFFRDETLPALWKSVLLELSASSKSPSQKTELVAQARDAFAVFEHALKAVVDDPKPFVPTLERSPNRPREHLEHG